MALGIVRSTCVRYAARPSIMQLISKLIKIDTAVTKAIIEN